MARKASIRHQAEHLNAELNLNPMMDLFAVLIPALLMMSAVVEVTLINISAPSIQSSPSSKPDASKPPLHLTVSIMEHGFLVSGTPGVFDGDGAQTSELGDRSKPSIPVIKKSVSCSRYRQITPPPRSLNQGQPPCSDGIEERLFWTYDLKALTDKIIAIKESYPDERQLVVQADAIVEYETLIDTLDATRDIKEASGEIRLLFDEVLISPAQL